MMLIIIQDLYEFFSFEINHRTRKIHLFNQDFIHRHLHQSIIIRKIEPFSLVQAGRMQKGIVFDIMRFSTRDGPGIRTTVFFKGCPLKCLWCHNPESQSPHKELLLRPNLCIGCLTCVSACPEGAVSFIDGNIHTDRLKCRICGAHFACVDACTAEAREVVGREMTAAEVMAEIRKDRAFYDESGGGVTFSGGEPLMQPDFLLDLLKACKAEGISTIVDTSGYATWSVLEQIHPSVDLFLYDLKAVDDAVHERCTGVSNALILANLRRLSELGHPIVIRMPLIPGINDREEDIRLASELIASLPHLDGIELMGYHLIGVEKYRRLGRAYSLNDLTPPTTEHIQNIAEILKSPSIPISVGD